MNKQKPTKIEEMEQDEILNDLKFEDNENDTILWLVLSNK